MGLFDRLRGEFIDVIEWVEDDRNTIAYRFPTHNREIQMGSSLIVRESQQAIFVYQGEIADVFEPGHYKLSTANMPLMTTLQHWTHGFNSPFKSEVYFINMRQFPDLKWGTPSPITLRDADFGVLRIRAFGSYAMKATDPRALTGRGAGAHAVTDHGERRGAWRDSSKRSGRAFAARLTLRLRCRRAPKRTV